MSTPAPDPRLSVRVAALEAEIESLNRMLQRIGALSRRTVPRDVRLAKTIKDPNTNTYPTDGQTFWIEFLDSHYTASQGDQTPTHTGRSTNVVAHNVRDAFLAEGTIVLATWQRGLGAYGTGEWWIDLIGGTMPGKCTSDITARASTTPGQGTVDLHHLSSGVLTSLSAEITAYSDFTATIPNGSWVIVGQDPEGTWWLVSADCP